MTVLKHKSLAAQNHDLSYSQRQVKILSETPITPFSESLKKTDMFPLNRLI